jgi:NarL family two-component system response regulator LiaR
MATTAAARATIRVMVVDDHDMVRRGLATMLQVYDDLELAGEAADGEAAVGRCAELRPDVVLMDLLLPGLDGAAATAAVRARCPAVQVLALTSFREDDLVQRAIAAGAIGFLYKNVSADELADAIRAAHAGRPTLASEAMGALLRGAQRAPAPGHDLTAREREVLGLLVAGAEQRRDRRSARGQRLDRQVPRQRHPRQAGGRRAHRGGRPCAPPPPRPLSRTLAG